MSNIRGYDPSKYVKYVTDSNLELNKSNELSKAQLLRIRFSDGETCELLGNRDQLDAVINFVKVKNLHPNLLNNLEKLKEYCSGEKTSQNPIFDADTEATAAARVPISTSPLKAGFMGFGGCTPYFGFGAPNAQEARVLDVFKTLEASPSVSDFESAPYILWKGPDEVPYLSFKSDLGDIIHLEVIESDEESITFKDPFRDLSTIYEPLEEESDEALQSTGIIKLNRFNEDGSDLVENYCTEVLSKLQSPSESAIRYWSDDKGQYARVLVNWPGVTDISGAFKNEKAFYIDLVSGSDNEFQLADALNCIRPEEVSSVGYREFPTDHRATFVSKGCEEKDFKEVSKTLMKCLILQDGLTTAKSQRLFFNEYKAYLVIEEKGKTIVSLVISNPKFCEALETRYAQHLSKAQVFEDDV